MSELTDLELCKRIAEIEGKKTLVCDGKLIYIKDGPLTMNGKEYHELNEAARYFYNSKNECNYLADDVLWVSLIMEFEVSISFVFCKLLINLNGVHERNFTDTESLKRNALLLIIEAHKES